MKALTSLQKEKLSVFTAWLLEEMSTKRIVYLNESPVETKHIPTRALKDIVVKWNSQNESNIPYIIGTPNTGQSPLAEMAVYEEGVFTELTPDETGTRWTCIGFKPMDCSIINKITDGLKLYR